MPYASAVFPVVDELIVVSHEETGSLRGMRLLMLAADVRRGGWIDATGGVTVVWRHWPARCERACARILQRVATV